MTRVEIDLPRHSLYARFGRQGHTGAARIKGSRAGDVARVVRSAMFVRRRNVGHTCVCMGGLQIVIRSGSQLLSRTSR